MKTALGVCILAAVVAVVASQSEPHLNIDSARSASLGNKPVFNVANIHQGPAPLQNLQQPNKVGGIDQGAFSDQGGFSNPGGLSSPDGFGLQSRGRFGSQNGIPGAFGGQNGISGGYGGQNGISGGYGGQNGISGGYGGQNGISGGFGGQSGFTGGFATLAGLNNRAGYRPQNSFMNSPNNMAGLYYYYLMNTLVW